MNDPIADMIIQIKNAGETGKESVTIPYSNIKFAIAEVLEKEGFIKSVAKKGKKVGKSIKMDLLFENNFPKIKGVKRVSKFSRRVYLRSGDIKPVKNFYGKLILTTPKGIMTDNEAKKEKIGGEALFKIW